MQFYWIISVTLHEMGSAKMHTDACGTRYSSEYWHGICTMDMKMTLTCNQKEIHQLQIKLIIPAYQWEKH